MKIKRFSGKTLAVFLSAMMVFTSIPSAVFAVDVATDSTSASTEIEATAETVTTGTAIGGDTELFAEPQGYSIAPVDYVKEEENKYYYKCLDPVYLTVTGKVGDVVTVANADTPDTVILSYTLDKKKSTFDIKTVATVADGQGTNACLPVGSYVVTLISNGVAETTANIEVGKNLNSIYVNKSKLFEYAFDGDPDTDGCFNTTPGSGTNSEIGGTADYGCIQTDKDVYTEGEDIHTFGYVSGNLGLDGSGVDYAHRVWVGIYEEGSEVSLSTPLAFGDFYRIMGDAETYEDGLKIDFEGISKVSYKHHLGGEAVYHLNDGDDLFSGHGFFRRHIIIQSLPVGKYEIRYFVNCSNFDGSTLNSVDAQSLTGECWGRKKIEVLPKDGDSTHTGYFRTNKVEYNYGEDIILTNIDVSTGASREDDTILICRESDVAMPNFLDFRLTDVNLWIYKIKVRDLLDSSGGMTKKSALLQNCEFNSNMLPFKTASYNLAPGRYCIMYFEADAWEASPARHVKYIVVRDGTQVTFDAGAYKVDELSDSLANGQVAVSIPHNYSSITSGLKLCKSIPGEFEGLKVIYETEIIENVDRQPDCVLDWGVTSAVQDDIDSGMTVNPYDSNGDGKLDDYASLMEFPLEVGSLVTTADLIDHTIIPNAATCLKATVRLNSFGTGLADTVLQTTNYTIPLPEGVTKFDENDFVTEFQVIGNPRVLFGDENKPYEELSQNGKNFRDAVNDSIKTMRTSYTADGKKFERTLVIVGNITGDGTQQSYKVAQDEYLHIDRYQNTFTTYGDMDRDLSTGLPSSIYTDFFTKDYTSNDEEECVGGANSYTPSYHSHDHDRVDNKIDSSVPGNRVDWPYRLIFMGTNENGDISVHDRNRVDQEIEELRKTSNKPVFIFISDPMESTVSGTMGDTNTSKKIDNNKDGVVNFELNQFKNSLRKHENVFLFSGYNQDPKTGTVVDNGYHLNNEHTFHAGIVCGPVNGVYQGVYTVPSANVSSTSPSYSTYRYSQWGATRMQNSNGYYVRVREDGTFFLMGRDFTAGKYLPSACFSVRFNDVHIGNEAEDSVSNLTISVNGEDDNVAEVKVLESDGTLYDNSEIVYRTNDVHAEDRVIFIDTDGNLDEDPYDDEEKAAGPTFRILPIKAGTAKVIIHTAPSNDHSTVATKKVINVRVVEYGGMAVIKTATDEDGNKLYDRDDKYTFKIKSQYGKETYVWDDNAYGYDQFGNETIWIKGRYVLSPVPTDEYYHPILKYTVTLQNGKTENRTVAYDTVKGATFTLKGGEKAEFTNTILGNSYTITENAEEKFNISSVTTKINDVETNHSVSGIHHSLTVDPLSAEKNKAEFINELVTATVVLKYYDRTTKNGVPLDINSTATEYTKRYYGSDVPYADGKVNTEKIIVDTGVALENSLASVENLLDKYYVYTSQEEAMKEIAKTTNLHTGAYYGAEEYHTNQYGYPQAESNDGKCYWQNGKNELADKEKWVTISDDGLNVKVWLFNQPKKYSVKAYGVADTSSTDLNKLDNGYYVSNSQTEDFKAYYNQRPGGEPSTEGTATNHLANYGIDGYVDEVVDTQKKINYKGTELKFLYWSYDPQGETVATTDTVYNFRIASDVTLYAIYGGMDAEPPKGVTAIKNDNDAYSNGTTDYIRFNQVMNPYGYQDDYCADGGFISPDGITDVSVVYVKANNSSGVVQSADAVRQELVKYAKTYSDTKGGKKKATLKVNGQSCVFNAIQYDVVLDEVICGDYEVTLTNKNRVQLSTSFKKSTVKGCVFHTFIMMRVDGEWVVSDNAITYENIE